MSPAAEVNGHSSLSHSPKSQGADRLPRQLGGEEVVLDERQMLERTAEGQRRRADASLQPGRVEVIGLPAEGGAQAVEGAEAMAAHEDLTVLDARRDDERASGGVRGSLHIPIHELSGRIEEIPAGEVWVYCGSGYRASIAASLLVRAGRRPVLVDGGYADPDTGAEAVGLHTQPVPA